MTLLCAATSAQSAQNLTGRIRPVAGATGALRAPIALDIPAMKGSTLSLYMEAPLLSALPLVQGLGAGIVTVHYAPGESAQDARPLHHLEIAATNPVTGSDYPAQRVRELVKNLERSHPDAVATFFDGTISAAGPTVSQAPDFEKVKFSFPSKPGWLESELMKDMMRHSWDRQVWPFLKGSLDVPADAAEKTTMITRRFQGNGLNQSARVEVRHPTLGSLGEFEYRLEKSSAKMTLRRLDGGR